MKFVIMGIATVAVFVFLVLFFVRQNRRENQEPVTVRSLALTTAKVCGILLAAGAALALIGLALAGFDMNNLNVTVDDMLFFGIA